MHGVQEHYLYMIKTEIKKDIEKKVGKLKNDIRREDILSGHQAASLQTQPVFSTHRQRYTLLLEDISCADLLNTGIGMDAQDPCLTVSLGIPQTSIDYDRQSKSTRRMTDAGIACKFTEVFYQSQVHIILHNIDHTIIILSLFMLDHF